MWLPCTLPLFCEIQWNGKSKITYKLKKYCCTSQAETKDTTVKLILCCNPEQADIGEKERKIFDVFANLNDSFDSQLKFAGNVSKIFKVLNSILDGVTEGRVVIFFDETHYLLGKKPTPIMETTSQCCNAVLHCLTLDL